ncbi:hypothetical protein H310_02699 [Aphanomyces invadans]|uniref:Uncharacterized protein n=1 Tax=Aphanomyces invadans TaxID=157072 RepID=A0A024ULH8_9STRA|nr:hypothetical protein H310_02699 [Aphanomyces invadans]ETW06443.1 hypothetical protein H310_02699 [Aphanomyces invadans]|eukprot:XP_008864518.1 hypothetical protein H310_02699 [Aphanomyces invadans]
MSFDAPFLRQTLLDAAKDGDLDTVVHTLDEGGASIANLIDSVDAATGMTALHHCCMRGFVDIVCYLVRHGAAVDALDHFNKTPLHHACHFGFPEVVFVLLDSGRVHVEKLYYMNAAKLTCLQTAAAKGHITILRLLLLHGDVVDGVNSVGETALHLAAAHNHLDIVDVLVSCGANPQQSTTATGDTPLHYACRAGSTEVAVYLVGLGQSIHDPNTDIVAESALQLARQGRHSVLANAIVEKAYLDATAKADADRVHAMRQQKVHEMEAIRTYLKAMRHGEAAARANEALAAFPRLKHV